MKTNRSIRLIRCWFLLTALIGAACLLTLASVGEASLHSVFLGYSASRLAMMAGLLIAVFICLSGALDRSGGSCGTVLQFSRNYTVKVILTVLFMLLSFGWLAGGFLADEDFHPFFERIQPLLLYGMFFCGSGRLLLEILRCSADTGAAERSAVRRSELFFFLTACGIYIVIRITGIGIVPDEMDWQPTGMAIQYWEIGLSMWIARHYYVKRKEL